jgi:hypothetical protein
MPVSMMNLIKFLRSFQWDTPPAVSAREPGVSGPGRGSAMRLAAAEATNERPEF